MSPKAISELEDDHILPEPKRHGRGHWRAYMPVGTKVRFLSGDGRWKQGIVDSIMYCNVRLNVGNDVYIIRPCRKCQTIEDDYEPHRDDVAESCRAADLSNAT